MYPLYSPFNQNFLLFLTIFYKFLSISLRAIKKGGFNPPENIIRDRPAGCFAFFHHPNGSQNSFLWERKEGVSFSETPSRIIY